MPFSEDAPLPDPGSATTQPAESLGTFTTDGPFRLIQRLGSGGMGEVWLAEQTEPVKRLVALKIIKPGMESRQVIARFEAERQALALMVHPSIAAVYDGGTTHDGRPYFVMEYVKGEPLTTYCDRHRLGMRDRIALFQQVCEGVQHAHQKGVIHRDLKPSNVLVTVVDEHVIAKIIDFGVAKAIAQPLTERTLFTELGVLVGTPEYMSPEQAEMGPLDVDTRTDVYALGVMLYELLTGALPLDRSEMRQAGLDAIRQMIREREPLKPSTRVSKLKAESSDAARNRHVDPDRLARLLRGDLDWITMKALEKDRTRRYGSASDLAADLARYLRSEPVVAGPPSAVYRLGKFARRHPAGLGAGAAIVVLLAAFAIAMALQARRIAAERDVGARERERAEQVSAFLVSLFRATDPNTAKGAAPTARDLLDRGVARVDAELKDQPLTRAALLHAIGGAYYALGRYSDAVPPLESAYELRKGLQGAQRADLAETVKDLGRVYHRLGKIDLAEAKYREALDLRRAVYGPDHVKVAQSLANLAGINLDRGQFADAEKGYRDAVAIATRVGSRAEAASLLASLSAALSRAGRGEEAVAAMRQSAEAMKGTLGVEHTSTLIAMSNLGRQLFFLSRYDEAQALQTEVLRVRRKMLGPDHEEIASSLFTLGETLTTAGQLTDAEALLRESVAMHDRVNLGPNAERAWTLNGLGWNLDEQGRHDESERAYRDALEMFTKAPDATRADRVFAIDGIAQQYLARKQFAEAERLLRESLAARQAAGAAPGVVAWSQTALGGLLCERGKVDEGAALADAALQAWGGDFKPGHMLLARAERAVGRCLVAKQRFSEAEGILTRAYTVLASSSTASRDARAAAESLVTLYEKWGKADKARAWRAKGLNPDVRSSVARSTMRAP
jgi:non-specific serine/threonine protein kinase/serine/threonine-protein kinase